MQGCINLQEEEFLELNRLLDKALKQMNMKQLEGVI